jgi:hypothetical protein
VKAHEGQLVEIDLERSASGGLQSSASAIAGLAAGCPVDAERIEVWPYHPNDRPGPASVAEYLVLENLGRQIDVPSFAERVGTEASKKLRAYLREHVFLVKRLADKGRWEPKARSRQRMMVRSVQR